MHIQIKTFGKLTDLMEADQRLDIPNSMSLQALLEDTMNKVPQLKKERFQVALNDELTQDWLYTLKEGDTIALLPPFAGG